MPSGRRRKQPDQPVPVFFIDRSLGRHDVAEALRQRGIAVVLMHEMYPNGADQHISDETWIDDVSALGYVALTKDVAVFRDHRQTLERSTLRVFALDSARLTGAQMADRVLRHLNRILQRCNKPGPYLYVIHSGSIERKWSPGT